jgi:hypothetical protein
VGEGLIFGRTGFNLKRLGIRYVKGVTEMKFMALQYFTGIFLAFLPIFNRIWMMFAWILCFCLAFAVRDSSDLSSGGVSALHSTPARNGGYLFSVASIGAWPMQTPDCQRLDTDHPDIAGVQIWMAEQDRDLDLHLLAPSIGVVEECAGLGVVDEVLSGRRSL